MMSGRKVAGTIRSLVNARSLQFEWAKMLHETLLVPVLIYGNETMIWGEKERSRIRTVKMNKLRGLLGIRGNRLIAYAWIRVLGRVAKGWMNGFTKIFSYGLAISKEWEIIGLLKGYMWKSVLVVP